MLTKLSILRNLAEAASVDPRLEAAGVTGYNKPKKTPNHKTKSHVVVAKSGDEVKIIRFGQQGVSGSPAKKGESPRSCSQEKVFQGTSRREHRQGQDASRLLGE